MESDLPGHAEMLGIPNNPNTHRLICFSITVSIAKHDMVCVFIPFEFEIKLDVRYLLCLLKHQALKLSYSRNKKTDNQAINTHVYLSHYSVCTPVFI